MENSDDGIVHANNLGTLKEGRVGLDELLEDKAKNPHDLSYSVVSISPDKPNSPFHEGENSILDLVDTSPQIHEKKEGATNTFIDRALTQ